MNNKKSPKKLRILILQSNFNNIYGGVVKTAQILYKNFLILNHDIKILINENDLKNDPTYNKDICNEIFKNIDVFYEDNLEKLIN